MIAGDAARGTLLLLEDDEDLADYISACLEDAGYIVRHAADGHEGLSAMREELPDLVVSDVMMPGMGGLEFLTTVRADPRLSSIPLVFLTTQSSLTDIVGGLELGADDYLVKPFKPEELVARVHSKMTRVPVPVSELRRDRVSGMLSAAAFAEELRREHARAKRGGYAGTVARLVLPEIARLRNYLGPNLDRALASQLGALLSNLADPLASVGREADGSFMLLLPAMGPDVAAPHLEKLADLVAAGRFTVGGETVRITPSIGFAGFDDGTDADQIAEAARIASLHSALHLDLRPARFTESMRAEVAARTPSRWATLIDAVRLPAQMALTFALAWSIPLAIYILLGDYGDDVSGVVYWIVVIAIAMTAFFIWVEGFLSLHRADPPSADHYPPASAIIAAYLPNEAATLESTIESFLSQDYLGDLQVILAYNTPHDMPFEDVLADISRRDPRFVPLRVRESTSKAQNVNAALAIVNGEFTGVFDADHQPDPGSFKRAWDWLASGADIVQGHCFIRNGATSWVARLVAIEFEQIYAVSHPGRARLHGFGIFGGSNGYWKTERLRATRFRGSMLTEDIDSSLRVVERGGRIVSDPCLVSRELSPTTLTGLTNQRLRWAQGWFQVSKKRFWPMMASPHLNLRNKLGVFHLLVWREIFPWVSLQIVPIIAYWALQAGGLSRIDWFVPLLVVLSLFTLATGPGQILFTWRNADPHMKAHRRWFVAYFWRAILFYAEYKNLLARVAQLKEFAGEKAWKVTPRG